MSGHLLRRVVKILKTKGRRHEEILKPKGPILRLWAPKAAFTKACSGGWRSGHKLRRKKTKKLIGAEDSFTKAWSVFRQPGHKLGQKVEILEPEGQS